jgi:nitroreductase
MLLDKLNWRYATKKMDHSKPVSEDKVQRILEAIRLAPTSSGLQPYEVIVVKNPAKAKIRCLEPAQVTDGSHLLVCRLGQYTPTHQRHVDLVNAERP